MVLGLGKRRISLLGLSLFDNTGRIPSNNMKLWDVLCHHTPRTNRHSPPNSDTRTQNCITPEPAILAYRDQSAKVEALDAVT